MQIGRAAIQIDLLRLLNVFFGLGLVTWLDGVVVIEHLGDSPCIMLVTPTPTSSYI